MLAVSAIRAPSRPRVRSTTALCVTGASRRARTSSPIGSRSPTSISTSCLRCWMGDCWTSRPGLARFRRRHYLGEEHVPLVDAVRDVVAAQAGVRPAGPIRVLTNLSSFGHCFNPVSFYYCMDERAERWRRCSRR